MSFSQNTISKINVSESLGVKIMPRHKNNSVDVKGSKMGKFGNLATIAASCVIGFCVGTSTVHAELPSVKVETSNLISPSSANNYYGNGIVHTTELGHWNGSRPVKITELAKGLGSESLSASDYADRVYEYIWKNINTEFRYGLSKGAFGTIIDQSGTAFDQTHLMVELLREGGLTVSYQAGTITLNATQFSVWTGITNAVAACRFMADGGIPASINGSTSASCSYSGNVTSVTLSHIWVSANGKLYDPSYKTHDFKTGIDLASAMNCGTDANSTCGSSIETAAMTGVSSGTTSGVAYLQNINQTSAETQLKSLAIALENHIKSSNPHAELDDIIGGQEINIDAMPTASISLPYSSAVERTWSGDIPNQYRTTLRIRFDNIDKTVYADEIAGIRLRLFGNMSGGNQSTAQRKISLYAEYKILDTSTRSNGSEDNDDLTLSVNHPYSVNGGSYMDFTMIQQTHSQVVFGPGISVDGTYFRFDPITIINGWGDTGQNIISHYNELQSAQNYVMDNVDASNPDSTLENCGGADAPVSVYTGVSSFEHKSFFCLKLHVPTHVATWLAQNSEMLSLTGKVNDVKIQLHHNLGGATSGGFNAESSLSFTSSSNDLADRRAAIFSVSSLSSRLEASVSEQLFDTWEGISSVSMLALSNEKSHKFLEANSGNISNVLTQITNYTPTIQSLIQTYVADGHTVFLPQNGVIGEFSLQNGTMNFLTAAFYAYKPSGERISFVYGEGYKGGGGASHDPMAETIKSTDLMNSSLKNKKYYGVNDATGTVTLSPPPDIVTGTGGFPYSLPFQRTYSSTTNATPHNRESIGFSGSGAPSISFPVYSLGQGAHLGGGWTHNYQISVNMGSDAFQSFGIDSALDASSVLAGIYVLRDINRGTQSFQQHMTAVFTANWWGKKLQNNIVNVKRGATSETFVRLSDGVSFNPPPGSADLLTQSGTRSGPFVNIPVIKYYYSGITFLLTTKDGQKLSFDLAGQGTTVSSYVGAPTTIPTGQKQFKITSWDFPNGVNLTFDYIFADSPNSLWNYTNEKIYFLSKISNNLGRSLSFTLDADFSPTSAPITEVSDENGRAVLYYTVEHSTGILENKSVWRASNQSWAPFDFVIRAPDNSKTVYSYRTTAEQYNTARVATQIEKWYTSGNHNVPYLTFIYDGINRLKSLKNINQNITNYLVGSISNEFFKRSEIVDALGNRTNNNYDQNNRHILVKDPLGRVTTKEYDGIGRLVKTILPEGNSTEYSYDVRHNQTEVRQIAKSGSGETDIVTSSSYMEGASVLTCINMKTCNKLSSVTDGNGNVTSYTYEASTGNLLTETKPAVTGGSPVTTLTYNGFGQILTVTDPENMVSKFTYDTQTNHSVLKSAITDSGAGRENLTTSVTYDAVGNVLTVDGPRTDVSDISTYEYDSLRRVEKSTAPDGSFGKNIFDLDGQLIRKEKYANGGTAPLQVTETDYTSTGQVESAFGPECFDAAGVRNTTLPGCNITTNYYDVLDRAKVMKDGEGRKTKTIFYDDGSVHKVIKAWQGNPDNVAEVANDNDSCTIVNTNQQCYATYTYWPSDKTLADAKDYNGQQASVTDAKGNKTEYFYDGHDRLEKFQLPHPTTPGISNAADYEQYTYDDNGNMLTKRKRDGKIITMTYDALGRVKSKTPGTQSAVVYTYDKVGRQTDVDFAGGGHLVHHDYDTAGRLWKTTDNGRVIEYAYDAAGNRTKVDYPNEAGETDFWVEYTYDNLNRVDKINQNGATELADYGYDASGRRMSVSLGNGSKVSYDYHDDDALENLTHDFNADGVVLGDDVQWTYGFNAVNQLTSKSISNAAYQWQPSYKKNNVYQSNGLNQYTTIANSSMDYDLNGNLKSDGVWTYGYDAENMLVNAARPGVSASYIYDPVGRRSAKTSGGTTTTFLHDGVEEIADYEGAGATKTLARRYVHGPGVDEYLVMYTGTGTGSPQYYHANHQGSIIAMSDGAGVVQDQYSYDSYGNSDDLTGNPFRYTGRRLDEETGLYYYRARYYSPAIGRFLQTDPIGYGDGLNWYAYVQNDPMNKNDPEGENSIAAVDPEIRKVALVGAGAAAALQNKNFTPDSPMKMEIIKEINSTLGGAADVVEAAAGQNDILSGKSSALTGVAKVAGTYATLANATVNVVGADNKLSQTAVEGGRIVSAVIGAKIGGTMGGALATEVALMNPITAEFAPIAGAIGIAAGSLLGAAVGIDSFDAAIADACQGNVDNCGGN